MIATLEQGERVERSDVKATVASLESVSKNYTDERALHGVNFRVRAGEVVALPGPNGDRVSDAPKGNCTDNF